MTKSLVAKSFRAVLNSDLLECRSSFDTFAENVLRECSSVGEDIGRHFEDPLLCSSLLSGRRKLGPWGLDMKLAGTIKSHRPTGAATMRPILAGTCRSYDLKLSGKTNTTRG